MGERARSGSWDADRRQAQPFLLAMLHALEVPVTFPALWSQSSSRPGWLFRFAGKTFYWPCLRLVRNDWGAGPGVRRGMFMNNLTKWQPLSRRPCGVIHSIPLETGKAGMIVTINRNLKLRKIRLVSLKTSYPSRWPRVMSQGRFWVRSSELGLDFLSLTSADAAGLGITVWGVRL